MENDTPATKAGYGPAEALSNVCDQSSQYPMEKSTTFSYIIMFRDIYFKCVHEYA